MRIHKYRGIYRLAMLALVASFTLACSKDAEQPLAEAKVATQSEVTIDLDGTLADFPEDIAKAMELEQASQARLGFIDRGLKNGFSFRFDQGEQFALHTYWQQGAIKGVAPVVQMTVLNTEARPEGKPRRWTVKAKLTVPAGINLSSNTPIYVSGAIGVKEISADGKALVPSSGAMYQHLGRKYVVPFYFPKTECMRDAQGAIRLVTDLEIYGSYLAVQLRNTYDTPYHPREISFKTSAFSTEGEMNLSGDGYPSWTTKQTEATDQIVRLIYQGNVPAQTEKAFFVWVKPNTNVVGKILHTEVRSHLTEQEQNHPELGADYGTSQSEVEFPDQRLKGEIEEGKVYRLKMQKVPRSGGLIITEVFMNKDNKGVAWELYNSSSETIDLYDFYMFRGRGKSTPLLSGDMTLLWDQPNKYRQSFTGHKELSKIERDKPGEFLLEPGKMALFLGMEVALQDFALTHYSGSLVNIDSRELIKYAFNIPYIKTNETAFHAKEGVWYAIVKGAIFAEENIVDVFYRFKDDTAPNLYLDATYMRKPYRDVPRSYMEVNRQNSDWVIRPRSENSDWGFRFGHAWEGEEIKPGNPRYLGYKRVGHQLTASLPTTAGFNGYYTIVDDKSWSIRSSNRPILHFQPKDIGVPLPNGEYNAWKDRVRYLPPKTWKYTSSYTYPNWDAEDGSVQAY